MLLHHLPTHSMIVDEIREFTGDEPSPFSSPDDAAIWANMMTSGEYEFKRDDYWPRIAPLAARLMGEPTDV